MAKTILKAQSVEPEESVDLGVLEGGDTYLVKDNYLSEFSDSDESKELARTNIGAAGQTDVDTVTDRLTDSMTGLNDMIDKHINPEDYASDPTVDQDPHNIDAKIRNATVDKVVTTKGEFYVNKPVYMNVVGGKRLYLATELDVSNAIADYEKVNSKDIVLNAVDDKLVNYAKLDDVYTKGNTYSKAEVDNKVAGYVKRDGTTSFTSPVSGVYPKLNSHLATLQYVTDQLYKHNTDYDPHGFIKTLNNRLLQYAKAANVYDKTETYSRTQLDSIIREMLGDVVLEMITDHLNQYDPHEIFTKMQSKGYVKQDGTVPFKSRIKGIDAVDSQDLVTLHQVEEKIQKLADSTKDATWITSGPVETTVGFIEDNTPMPRTMTFQELCDAIFYGNTISLTVPDYVGMGKTGKITVCVHGGVVDYAQLYQGDLLIYTFQAEDLVDGCVTVDSEVINKDTDFTLKVFYTNGAMHEETKTVKCSLPVFVGLLPKWKFGNTVTYEYLQELEAEDVEGTKNRFLDAGDNVKSINFKYEFEDKDLRHPFVVIPESYPSLTSMETSAQTFDTEAFDIIDMIPLRIYDKDIIYKMYIYREALSRLNQEVTYKFSE